MIIGLDTLKLTIPRSGYGISGNLGGISVDFTDASAAVYVYTIPEPGSLALLAVGGLDLLGARRRQKRVSQV